MDDTLLCPICNNKLRNVHLNDQFKRLVDKKSDFVERSCTLGYNHSLQFLTDKLTGKVDWIKVSLNPQYSRFIEINYTLEKCRISCHGNRQVDYIEINKILIPDFPVLRDLKTRVSLYVLLI